MKNKLLLLGLAMWSGGAVEAQTSYPTDSLVADFKYFVHQMEAAHPDPYTNYGGRALFRREVSRQIWRMKNDSVTTAEELGQRLNAFLSPLQDGHSFLYLPEDRSQAGKYAPVNFRVINDGLIVRSLPVAYKHLIGSRLTAVESMSVDELYDALARQVAVENIIGRYTVSAYQLRREAMLRKLVPELPTDTVRYHLLSPDGETVTVALPLLSSEEVERVPMANQPDTDAFPNSNLTYAFTDEGRKTMYFRSTSIMARDNIEAMRKMGMPYYDRLKSYYRSLQWDFPEDTLKAIQGMPSYSEEFRKMLLSMKENRSENLIVDLRGNGGGWTPITLPTLYQLWGDEYLKKNMETKSYRILSPLYMKKLNMSLKQFNERWNASYEYGDYTFFEDRPIVSGNADRATFINGCMSSVKDLLTAQEGQPVYTPENIYVITDAYTFSAAFHYAFYLWKMGAKIVGVACRQAPNTYMEQTELELPVTHLKGSLSNSQQIFLPIGDERAKVFRPDYTMTYDDFKRYGFNRQAEILYLLDMLK